jgi:D,D-heptose 1,7-bisphosphate phosphatase
VKLFDTVGSSLFKLKSIYNFKLIVISNQSGVARGLISIDDVEAVNNRINDKLGEYGVSIDKFYYCPFHPEFNSEDESKCRKPSPLMIFNAAEECEIDLSKSYLIGDSKSDIECGKNAGVKTILVLTGYGREHLSLLQKESNLPNFVAENFSDACDLIIKDFSGED